MGMQKLSYKIFRKINSNRSQPMTCISTNKKIVSLEEIAQISKEEREKGRRLVQCHGVCDLVHPGHIKHLQEAKKLGDLLVVSLTADEFVNKGPDRPVFKEELR